MGVTVSLAGADPSSATTAAQPGRRVVVEIMPRTTRWLAPAFVMQV